MSIPEGDKKINIPVLIAICVTLGFFLVFGGLKLHAYAAKKEGVRVIGVPESVVSQPTRQVQASQTEESSIVASKSGKKYHFSYCPGAKQITEKNRIFFASVSAAERAGYTLAGNCKPNLKTQ